MDCADGGDRTVSDLKPCPFCGNTPTIRIYNGEDGWRDRYAVLCRYDEGGCGAESGLYHYQAEAIEAWNKRVPSAQSKIIRCKECKHYKTHTLFGNSQSWCERLCDGFDNSLSICTEPDDYCSYAERRQDDY